MKRRTWIKSLGILSLASLIPKWASAAWSDLASNQLVSGSNLQDAVDNNIFKLNFGATISKTIGIITDVEANSLVQINPITEDDRAPKKSEFVAKITGYPVVLVYDVSDSGICAKFSGGDQTTYYSDTTPIRNYNAGASSYRTYLYTDSALTTPVSAGYYTDGNVYYSVTIGGGVLNTFACSLPPSCPTRALVFQICNSNSSKDDNFDIYLNTIKIGSVNLNSNSQIGSVFIASLTSPSISTADFSCPIGNMVYYYFDPSLVRGGVNEIRMVNTQNNKNSNLGSIGIRNYLISGGFLTSPCVIANLSFSGASGSNFIKTFDYQTCCE